MKPRYEAIFFDFDGVLADSEPVHYRCWLEVLRDRGVRMEWDWYCREAVGVTDRVFLDLLGQRTEPPVAGEELRSEFPRKRALFQKLMLEDPPVAPEILDLVRSLDGYKLAVVTSSNRAEIEPVLANLGILECFATCVYGSDVTRHKPAPDPYLTAARRLGVTRALVVEDSDPGAESGRAAGFDVLRIPHASQTAELLRAHLCDFR